MQRDQYTYASRSTCLVLALLLSHCGGTEPSPAFTRATLTGPPSGQFVSAGRLEFTHSLHTATQLGDGRVLITGGQLRPFTRRAGEPRAEVEIYEPVARRFTSAGRMGTERVLHTATRLDDGTVLIVGGSRHGFNDGTDSLNSAELFDPATGTMVPLAASLQQPRQAHTATRLSDGRILIVGGYDGTSGGRYLDTAELYDPATRRFTLVGSRMARPRQLHAATLLSTGQVLITGGFRSEGVIAEAELYDPATGRFVPAGSLQTPRALHQATLLGNGQVLLSGGAGPGSLASCELYDPASNTFLSTGSMSVPRQLHTATRLPTGLVLVTGGSPAFESTRAYGSAELYDPVSRQFRLAPTMLAARERHTATSLDSGAVLIVGGHEQGSVLEAELYMPAAVAVTVLPPAATVAVGGRLALAARVSGAQDTSVTWSASAGTITSAGVYTPPPVPGTYSVTATSVAAPSESKAIDVNVVVAPGVLSVGHSVHTETRLVDGRVLIVGGVSAPYTKYARPVQGAVEVFDPVRGTFASTTPLATPRSIHAATRLADGTVLVSGGWDGRNSLASAELFVPANPADPLDRDRWVAVGAMVEARQGHSATLLGDGRVLIVGGYSWAVGGQLDTAELYDPATRRFTALPQRLQVRRQLHTATSLATGQVLIAGGFGYGGALGSAELYDPVSGRFVATDSLRTRRFLHQATRLLDGRVLLTGGAGPDSLATCDLYDPGTGRFDTAPPRLRTPRQVHSATLLEDGRVFVAGGSPTHESLAALASVEIYDPVRNQFVALPALAYARERHTATLLASGLVLIVGGHAAANVLAAELYAPPPAPGLDSVSPSRASNTGGVTITLRGRNFASGATVTVDGVQATNVVVVSSSEITFTLPARPGVRGLVAVTVINPDQQAVSRADLFAYSGLEGGPIYFTNVGSVAVASEPQALVSGDFGGDGRADIAVVSTVAGVVNVLGGNGQGGLSLATTVTAGANPVSAAAADFNGDGVSDLAIANYGDYGTPSSNSISLFLGRRGQVGLQLGDTFSLGAAPRSLAVGDLNGDGLPDLVAAHDLEGTVSTLLARGNGRFAPRLVVAVNPSPWALATGDFDRDGRLDLAVAHSVGNAVSVLPGRGNGRFASALTTAVGRLPLGIATGDFDGDGVLDVVVANGLDGEVGVLLGNGDGSLRAAGRYAVGQMPQSLAVADYNGDGHLDVAVAVYASHAVSVLGGHGDGSFEGAVSFATGRRPVALSAVDLNGDGRPDLAVANEGTGDVSVLLNEAPSAPSNAMPVEQTLEVRKRLPARQGRTGRSGRRP